MFLFQTNRTKLGAKIILTCFFVLTIISCSKDNKKVKLSKPNQLFSKISSNQTGVKFKNALIETTESNYYQYMYTYIGGGVAAADFNNDGLVDLFFSSNSDENKLYLNKGNFKFDDITKKAGIEKIEGFNTGVSVADVNNDGFLDIYISRGGWIDDNNKFENLLYINNGDLTFTEKGKELGLNDENRAIQATFFDYDNDNDLDVYISNTPDMVERVAIIDLEDVKTNPKTTTLKGSDKLYQNDGTGHFTDVSIKSGILPDVGFGLNPQVGDINNDGWLDVYICNDFNVPDFAYVNNGDGTFTDMRNELFKHMSFNSMGGDMGDMNNDGLNDVLTLDMNPEDYIRSKTTMGMTSVDDFELMVANNYHYQYMHNMLHLNNGNNSFSEISKMAGIGNTDWSWSILSADFDLDGLNDIYVTNGVFRDVIDRDKNNEILEILRNKKSKPTKEDYLSFAKMLPQQKLVNYFFKNNGDLTFEDTSNKWADSIPTFSNGATYADLDNDGDLDIVVNNINEEATILKNNAIQQNRGNFLQLEFNGPQGNKFGNGVIAKTHLNDNKIQMRQLINTRGFLSSVSNKLHFGLQPNDSIIQLEIIWPDGKKQFISNVVGNNLISINYTDASNPIPEPETKQARLFNKMVFKKKHIDPYFNDLNIQVLLPHKLSQTGPGIAKADVNNDGIEDIYIGGGHTQSGELFMGQKNGSFKLLNNSSFIQDKQKEDVGATFFDADNDGDQDLYVVSGSYEFGAKPKLLQDRLYLNNGKGIYTKDKEALPTLTSAGSIVVSSDFDNDGDIDLFVGGRVIPGKYPYAPISYLLINTNGKFSIETPTIAPDLEQIGMVTDATWTDINNDNTLDLIVTGEWMGIEVFLNIDNKLEKSDNFKTLASSSGWWNKLTIADIDNDGDKDIIAGNLGLNYKFHASEKKPFHVYTEDFDYNGTADIMLAKYYKGKQVPVRGKGCTAQQMPHLKQKIKTYGDFANRDLAGILGEKVHSALHYAATEFRSGIFKNNGDNEFSFEPFTNEVQKSPINGIIYSDIDKDGIADLILSGNNYMAEVETTRADAGIGNFLKGNGDGTFESISHLKSGFITSKDTRNLIEISSSTGTKVLVINNNDTHDMFQIMNK